MANMKPLTIAIIVALCIIPMTLAASSGTASGQGGSDDAPASAGTKTQNNAEDDQAQTNNPETGTAARTQTQEQTRSEAGTNSDEGQQVRNEGDDHQIQTQAMVAGVNATGSGERMQQQNRSESGPNRGNQSLNGTDEPAVTKTRQQNQGVEQRVRVQFQDAGAVQLDKQGMVAQTSLLVIEQQTLNGTTLRVRLSNGKMTDVNIMPDAAAEKALEQLRLRTCTAEEGCSIELKEVGEGDQAKAAYEVRARQQVNVLGLLQAKMRLQARIDAENGEVLQAKKSWWAFLASENASP